MDLDEPRLYREITAFLHQRVVAPVAHQATKSYLTWPEAEQNAWEALLREMARRRIPSVPRARAVLRYRLIDNLREHGGMSRTVARVNAAADRAGERRPYLDPVAYDGLLDSQMPEYSEPGFDAVDVAVDFPRAMAVAARVLTPRDLAIVRARYLEGRTFAELGVEHGVTESRVCQIVHRGLAAVRAQFTPDG
jgi:DNA-directed RNA polymerase specialized sigma24 family protein